MSKQKYLQLEWQSCLNILLRLDIHIQQNNETLYCNKNKNFFFSRNKTKKHGGNKSVNIYANQIFLKHFILIFLIFSSKTCLVTWLLQCQSPIKNNRFVGEISNPKSQKSHIKYKIPKTPKSIMQYPHHQKFPNPNGYILD